MEERLQKIISRYGVASRRKAEELILERRVRVNGNTAVLGDTAIDGEDVIEVDGKVLRHEPERVYLMLHKPRGYVTTMADEKGRKDVTKLVEDCGARVYPVGRLDMYSEGLLIMTNDGELANRMMHPKRLIDKTYLVWVSNYAAGCEKALSKPIEIDGRRTATAAVRSLKIDGELALFEFIIHEGRNRQIRRLCEAAGLRVTRLRRIAEGPLTLGDLAVGTWRNLTDDELEALENI
ncbi:MAG: rRNA pseudouridine synthase [Oscillospiraceae bacterium]|nr:rRNA pseudouridine synthase [Oscillospiraceae bacterium]